MTMNSFGNVRVAHRLFDEGSMLPPRLRLEFGIPTLYSNQMTTSRSRRHIGSADAKLYDEAQLKRGAAD